MPYDSVSLKAKIKMKNQSVTAIEVRMGVVPQVGDVDYKGAPGAFPGGPEMFDVLIWVVATQA